MPRALCRNRALQKPHRRTAQTSLLAPAPVQVRGVGQLELTQSFR